VLVLGGGLVRTSVGRDELPQTTQTYVPRHQSVTLVTG
jgi:hypothetical protein